MRKEYPNFGAYLMNKRLSKGISSMDMAELIGISPGYYSDIERSRKNPPECAVLYNIVNVLGFSSEEKGIFFDLAGLNNSRHVIAPDLPDYIMKNRIVRTALRLAEEKADADDWRQFIEKLESK